MGLLTAAYLLSGVVLQSGYRQAEDPIIRQQLKWLRNGMLFGFAPFALLYAIPFVFDLPVQPVSELRGGHAAADSAHDRVRHRALPADGRGCHLPPRLCLYAGDAVRAGRLLRASCSRSAAWCRRTSRTSATPG